MLLRLVVFTIFAAWVGVYVWIYYDVTHHPEKWTTRPIGDRRKLR